MSKNQQELFSEEPVKDPILQRQFERLGEMIGDGLHLEPGGSWITKEYRKIMYALHPDIKDQQRELKQRQNKILDEKMVELLSNHPCKCGGNLKQTRSGAKTAKCEICGARYSCRRRK